MWRAEGALTEKPSVLALHGPSKLAEPILVFRDNDASQGSNCCAERGILQIIASPVGRSLSLNYGTATVWRLNNFLAIGILVDFRDFLFR